MAMSREIKTLATLGLFVMLSLAGCAKVTPIPAPTPTPTPSTAPTPTPAPIPKSPPVPTITPAQTGPYGDLVIALSTFGNERFDTAPTNATSSFNLLSPMFDYMLWLNGKELGPGLIERWEISPDGLSWTYYVRKGVKFHNGQEMTAKDVKFSIENYLRPDVNLTNLRNMVDHVDIVDDYTIRIYTQQGKQPYLPFMTALTANPAQGIVVPKDYVDQHGWSYFERYPVGTGSFKFLKHVPGDMVEYEAVDQHWKQVPAFKKLTTILMPEEVTRIASLKTGAADIVEIGIQSAGEVEAAGDRSFVLDIQTPAVQVRGAYDSRAAGMPASDIRVRQAMSLAINRDEIRKSFFADKAGPPMPAYFNESADDIDVAYWKDYAAKLYRYDQAEAQNLLKAAGYPNGFSIRLYTWQARGTPYLPNLAEVIQGYWAKIGIKAEIVVIDQGTYASWRKGPDPQFVGQATLSRQTSNLTIMNLNLGYENGGQDSLLGNGIPEFDRLINAARTETDTKKRQDIIAQMLKMASDTYVAAEVCSAPGMGALGDRVDLAIPFPPACPAIPPYANIAKHRG